MGEVVPVITVIVVGVAFIVIVAIIVGIVEAAQAPTWRRIATERRQRWEARQLEFHGRQDAETWDDD